MSGHAIAEKFRRALRNGSGATFTLDQLRDMARWGILLDLARREVDELCQVGESSLPPPEAPSATSTPSPSDEQGNLSIEQLSHGL